MSLENAGRFEYDKNRCSLYSMVHSEPEIDSVTPYHAHFRVQPQQQDHNRIQSLLSQKCPFQYLKLEISLPKNSIRQSASPENITYENPDHALQISLLRTKRMVL